MIRKVFFNVGKEDKFLTRLSRIFSGSNIYHVGFLSDDGETAYDMSLLKRAFKIQDYSPDSIILLKIPMYLSEPKILMEIAYTNGELSTRSTFYGIWDYLAFAIRPLYHILGKSTPNFRGVICSEWVNNKIVEAQGDNGFKLSDCPPSPTDLYISISNSMLEKGELTLNDIIAMDTMIRLKEGLRKNFIKSITNQ